MLILAVFTTRLAGEQKLSRFWTAALVLCVEIVSFGMFGKLEHPLKLSATGLF